MNSMLSVGMICCLVAVVAGNSLSSLKRGNAPSVLNSLNVPDGFSLPVAKKLTKQGDDDEGFDFPAPTCVDNDAECWTTYLTYGAYARAMYDVSQETESIYEYLAYCIANSDDTNCPNAPDVDTEPTSKGLNEAKLATLKKALKDLVARKK